MRVLGLDSAAATVASAERWLSELLQQAGSPAGLIACTHLVRGPTPHVAVSVSVPDDVEPGFLPVDTGEGATTAAAEHAGRIAGRAFLFPGVERLTGALTVAELLACSAIERVLVLGVTGEPQPGTLIDTRDFVRPQWMNGRLTLVCTPAARGRIAPFEVPNPTPCCANHA